MREHSNEAGARPAAQVMLDTMEPGAAVVMLSLLQWDAASGDRTASGILADLGQTMPIPPLQAVVTGHKWQGGRVPFEGDGDPALRNGWRTTNASCGRRCP